MQSDFSVAILEALKKVSNTFKILRGKKASLYTQPKYINHVWEQNKDISRKLRI